MLCVIIRRSVYISVSFCSPVVLNCEGNFQVVSFFSCPFFVGSPACLMATASLNASAISLKNLVYSWKKKQIKNKKKGMKNWEEPEKRGIKNEQKKCAEPSRRFI